MQEQRIIAISDLHGCYYSFIDILKEIEYEGSRDKLILLGDYIDRGPFSYEVIRAIRQLRHKHPDNVVCLKGNHEAMCVEAFGCPDWQWDRNGGRATRMSYAENNACISNDLKWMENLPLYHVEHDYIFCHAGLTHPKLEDNTEDNLLWGRSWIFSDDRPREKHVVFGHTPMKTKAPYKTASGDYCIDGGGVYGGTFGAFILRPDLTTEIAAVPLNVQDKGD